MDAEGRRTDLLHALGASGFADGFVDVGQLSHLLSLQLSYHIIVRRRPSPGRTFRLVRHSEGVPSNFESVADLWPIPSMSGIVSISNFCALYAVNVH